MKYRRILITSSKNKAKERDPVHENIRYCADIRLDRTSRKIYNPSLKVLAKLVALNIPTNSKEGGITDKLEYSNDITSEDRETFREELLSRLKKRRS